MNNHPLSKGHLAIEDKIFSPSVVCYRGVPLYYNNIIALHFLVDEENAAYDRLAVPKENVSRPSSSCVTINMQEVVSGGSIDFSTSMGIDDGHSINHLKGMGLLSIYM